MIINNMQNSYLISVDDKTGTCFVSPFNVESVRQSLGETYSLGGFGNPSIKIEGELYGRLRVLKAKDFNDVTYEDVMDLLKEKTNE